MMKFNLESRRCNKILNTILIKNQKNDNRSTVYVSNVPTSTLFDVLNLKSIINQSILKTILIKK